MYIYIYIYIYAIYIFIIHLMFLNRRSLFVVQVKFPCVVLWRREALDCRVIIPPEAWTYP